MSLGHAHAPHVGGDDDRPKMPRGLNLLLATILGLSAIATGVIAWRANVLSGHATEEFTLSTQAVNDANSLSQEAERAISGERGLFIAWRAAVTDHAAAQAASIKAMMSQSTRDALAWWQAQPPAERPLSPFVSANPDWDAPTTVVASQAALARADDLSASAHANLSEAHALEFFAALVAVALLAGGLSGVFDSRRARIGLITASGIVLAVCVVGAVLV